MLDGDRPVPEQPRADRRSDRRHRPDSNQLCPHHPDGGLHRQDDRATNWIGQTMDDTTTKEQEKFPAADEAANNNVDDLGGAPIESEAEGTSQKTEAAELEVE